MSTLQSRSGKDIDRRIRDEQGLGVTGHIDGEDVADPPVGAQARRFCGDAAHQFVGVEAALHQQLALGLVNQLDGPCGCRLAMRGVDDLEARDIEIELRRDRLDLARRAHQDRLDDAGGGGFADAAQRGLVAGMHHHGHGRRHLLGGRDQTFILHCLASPARSELRSWLDSQLVRQRSEAYDALALSLDETCRKPGAH